MDMVIVGGLLAGGVVCLILAGALALRQQNEETGRFGLAGIALLIAAAIYGWHAAENKNDNTIRVPEIRIGGD